MAEELLEQKDRNRTPLDIPWLRLWDQKSSERHAGRVFDKHIRLENIEFMNMLEELEFH